MHYDAYNDYTHAWEPAEILVGVVEEGGGKAHIVTKLALPKRRKK